VNAVVVKPNAIRGAESDRATLGQLLRLRAADHPNRTFVSFPDRDCSYAEVYARALAFAKGLIAIGLKPGGHVAVLMPNCPTYLELLFAVHLAGGVLVPINARFQRRELSYVLAHSDVEIVVTTDLVDEYTDFTGLLTHSLPGLADQPGGGVATPAAPRLRRIYIDGTKSVPLAEPLEALVAAGRNLSDTDVADASAHHEDDLALLLYTSGTTASPKGCEITHNALIHSWSAYGELVGLAEGQAMWTPCPLFHVSGIGVTVAALVSAATVMSMTHFEPEKALEHIERRKAEHLFPAFPTLTMGLLGCAQYDAAKLGFVRTVLNVAPAETQRMIQRLLPPNAILLTDFGMSEGAGMITATPLDATEEDRLDRNGTPLPGIEVRIAATDEPERLLPAGTPGEIQFRGTNAFRSYYKDDASTSATILAGGWIRTGDLGSLNERGSLRYLGRIKDMLKVGGENVTPLEVEAHLSTHAAVRMAQVVGRPSERYGEEPVAFIELADGAECTAEELIAYCVGELASYKVPREVCFVTSWPMSATKIQKFRLKELLDQE
jgi:acyl-CoA synthetase (AMP-forming)/AMP-acid ligase II